VVQVGLAVRAVAPVALRDEVEHPVQDVVVLPSVVRVASVATSKSSARRR